MDLPSVLLPPVLAVHLLATETLAGMLFFLLTVIAPARTVIAELGVDRRSGLDVWCRKLVFGCLALMLVTMVLWLGMTAASVSDAKGLGRNNRVSWAGCAVKWCSSTHRENRPI